MPIMRKALLTKSLMPRPSDLLEEPLALGRGAPPSLGRRVGVGGSLVTVKPFAGRTYVTRCRMVGATTTTYMHAASREAECTHSRTACVAHMHTHGACRSRGLVVKGRANW